MIKTIQNLTFINACKMDCAKLPQTGDWLWYSYICMYMYTAFYEKRAISTFIVLYKIWCQFHWISKSADLPQHFKCFHSLPNISNQIRWALDLRWQRPDQPFGLYGLKDGLLLRKDGKNVEPDWEKFESVDRTTVQKKSVEGFVDVSCLIPRITITCTLTWIYSIAV